MSALLGGFYHPQRGQYPRRVNGWSAPTQQRVTQQYIELFISAWQRLDGSINAYATDICEHTPPAFRWLKTPTGIAWPHTRIESVLLRVQAPLLVGAAQPVKAYARPWHTGNHAHPEMRE